MKKNLSFFAPLILWLCLSIPGFAQTGLKVDSLINFPVLPDTAYQGLAYDSVKIQVHNYSGNPYSGSVEVYMMADSLQHVDTLRDDTTVVFIPSGGDTILNARNGIVFNPGNFAAGDNIVVVWPYLRLSPFPIDSFYVQVHYTLLTGLDDPAIREGIVLYPVPARQVLRFTYTHTESIEQVRIFDSTGRLMLDSQVPPETLEVTSYPAGIYYVSLLRKDGSRMVKKILKL
jgi:hypothetical protein